MMSRTTARRRLGAAALATMAAGFLVSPAGAASREPTGECPPAQRDLVAEITKTADMESLRAAVWMDRDLEGLELLAERDWQHLGFECYCEATPRASHPVTAAIDVLVELTRLPARASLVVQHLLGAFAKVTPRVVRALL